MNHVTKSVVEMAYGPQYGQVEEMHKKLERISWFSNVGQESALEAQVEWVTKEEAIKGLQHHFFAQFLEEQHDQLLEQASQMSVSSHLERARDDHSEELFHSVFDAAFEIFEKEESEVVKKVCENIMLMIGCLCGNAAVNVLEKESTELLNQLLLLLEAGHLPILMENKRIMAF